MKGRAGRTLGVASHRRGLKFERAAIGRAVRLLDECAAEFQGGCPDGELSVALMSDADLAALHGRFLGDASATDVITFEGDSRHGTAGEVCISVDAAVRETGKYAGALSRELTLYVVHGWLHLAGYDDHSTPAKRRMRAAEARAMGILAAARAIPRFKLA